MAKVLMARASRSTLSPAREAFWLKGAMLFDLWFDLPHRPTRDADFPGVGPMDIEALTSTVQLDVGYGDAVTPGLAEAVYPTLVTAHLQKPLSSVLPGCRILPWLAQNALGRTLHRAIRSSPHTLHPVDWR